MQRGYRFYVGSLKATSNLQAAKLFFRSMGKDWKKAGRFVLQKTAKGGRDAARRQLRRAFDVKSFSTGQWLQYGIQSTGRVGADLRAAIWVKGGEDKKSRGFLRHQEYGGVRGSTHAGGRIGVPTERVPRGGSGRIPKQYRPGRLRKKYKLDAEGLPSGRRKYRSKRRLKLMAGRFAIFMRGSMIFRRDPKLIPGKRKPMIQGRKAFLWYNLAKRVRNRPRFKYYETIFRMIDQEFAKQLYKEVESTFTHAARKRLKQTARLFG